MGSLRRGAPPASSSEAEVLSGSLATLAMISGRANLLANDVQPGFQTNVETVFLTNDEKSK